MKKNNKTLALLEAIPKKLRPITNPFLFLYETILVVMAFFALILNLRKICRGITKHALKLPDSEWYNWKKNYAAEPLVCGICRREMTPEDNCGGDCVHCMAMMGDPDCIASLVSKDKNPVHPVTKKSIGQQDQDDSDQCSNCGSRKDPWFSRSEPMGYFCPDCGEGTGN